MLHLFFISFIFLFDISFGQLAINAIQLDGIDDYVISGTDSTLDISEQIIIEAWIKADFNKASTVLAQPATYLENININKIIQGNIRCNSI